MTDFLSLSTGSSAPLFHQAAVWLAQALELPPLVAAMLTAGGLFAASMGSLVLLFLWVDERRR